MERCRNPAFLGPAAPDFPGSEIEEVRRKDFQTISYPAIAFEFDVKKGVRREASRFRSAEQHLRGVVLVACQSVSFAADDAQVP